MTLVKFNAEVKTVNVKARKDKDGVVADVDMQVVLVASLDQDVLKALSGRTGQFVRVQVDNRQVAFTDVSGAVEGLQQVADGLGPDGSVTVTAAGTDGRTTSATLHARDGRAS